jgi:hypothetical protein
VEKLVYLIWDRPSRDTEELRRQFLDEVAPAVLALGARGLELHLDDADAQVPTMVPVPDDELPVRAAVSVWVDNHDVHGSYEAILAECGVRRGGYLVTESLYTDYGGNEHAPARDWPDGTRSPGLVMLTVFDKPQGMDDDTFYGHWYGHQSPMSEAMQPRCRYVRNSVVRAVTAGAPRYKAIVAEAWPSAELFTDLPAFFGSGAGDDTEATGGERSVESTHRYGSDLGERIRVMLDSTKLLYDPATMRTFTLSEYIVKS